MPGQSRVAKDRRAVKPLGIVDDEQQRTMTCEAKLVVRARENALHIMLLPLMGTSSRTSEHPP